MFSLHDLAIFIFLSCSLALPITLPPPSTIVSTRYTNQQVLDDHLTMYWNVDMNQEWIEVGLAGKCTGYVSWGMTRSGGMVNSDVYVGWVSTDGEVTAADYNIGESQAFGEGSGGVDTDTNYGFADNLLYFNGSEVDGLTTVIFIRNLSTGDPNDVIIGTSTLNVIYAWNSDSDGPSFSQHTTTPNPISIDFYTGYAKASNLESILKAHGAFMFLAWVCFAPAGYILARFLKRYKWWFPAHIVMMTAAVVAVLIGFALGITGSIIHFNTGHQIVGLIVVLLAFIQPFIGWLADRLFNPDRKEIPIFPDKVHWVIGWVAISMGVANVAAGFRDFGVSIGSIAAYSVIVSIAWAFVVSASVFQVVRGGGGHGGASSEKPPPTSKKQSDPYAANDNAIPQQPSYSPPVEYSTHVPSADSPRSSPIPGSSRPAPIPGRSRPPPSPNVSRPPVSNAPPPTASRSPPPTASRSPPPTASRPPPSPNASRPPPSPNASRGPPLNSSRPLPGAPRSLPVPGAPRSPNSGPGRWDMQL